MIDMIASQPQYAAHLEPVWAALPEKVRGSRDRRTCDAVLVAGWSDLRRATQRRYSRIALLEHGIGQSYGNGHQSYPGGRRRGSIDLFLSPNETAAGMDRAAYPNARVEVVGDPQLDALPTLEAEPGTVAISFHWDCYVAPETRSAFPHYRDAIPELAAAVPLIGHAHPRARVEMERFYRQHGIEFVADFDEVCRRASLFIADNTSCLYEFASTGRPVVVLSAPWHRREVEFGLRFWSAVGVGLHVGEPADLVGGVRTALVDTVGQRRDRERALAIAYGYRSGAAQRAAGVLVDWLADVAVAA